MASGAGAVGRGRMAAGGSGITGGISNNLALVSLAPHYNNLVLAYNAHYETRRNHIDHDDYSGSSNSVNHVVRGNIMFYEQFPSDGSTAASPTAWVSKIRSCT